MDGGLGEGRQERSCCVAARNQRGVRRAKPGAWGQLRASALAGCAVAVAAAEVGHRKNIHRAAPDGAGAAITAIGACGIAGECIEPLALLQATMSNACTRIGALARGCYKRQQQQQHARKRRRLLQAVARARSQAQRRQRCRVRVSRRNHSRVVPLHVNGDSFACMHRMHRNRLTREGERSDFLS